MTWGKTGKLLAPGEKAPRGTKKIIEIPGTDYRFALGAPGTDDELIEFHMQRKGGKA